MKTLIALLLLTFLYSTSFAQHGHLNAGALGTNQNDQLFFANGVDFIDSSGYVKTLNFTNDGRFAGYFEGNITLTSLPATAETGGADPNAAAFGSFLQFSMACLSGPEGGSFGFWEAGSTSPSLSLRPGERSTNLFALSESDGLPGSDPFGHIHGRRFTATKPGIYKVGFKAVDTSANGINGGPIHTPSDELAMFFQAGVNIQSIKPDLNGQEVRVRFGGAAGFLWTFQYASEIGTNTAWTTTHPVIGSDAFVDAVYEIPMGPQGFYRLVGVPYTP